MNVAFRQQTCPANAGIQVLTAANLVLVDTHRHECRYGDARALRPNAGDARTVRVTGMIETVEGNHASLLAGRKSLPSRQSGHRSDPGSAVHSLAEKGTAIANPPRIGNPESTSRWPYGETLISGVSVRATGSRVIGRRAVLLAGIGVATHRAAAASPDDDGSAGAPVGTPQMPHLLDGYRVRPPWKVAGVDYAVGIPASAILTDWKTLDIPNVTLGANSVRISDSNVVLDGIDFSRHDGASVGVAGVATATIQNCRFGGSNLKTIGTGIINSAAAESDSPELRFRWIRCRNRGLRPVRPQRGRRRSALQRHPQLSLPDH